MSHEEFQIIDIQSDDISSIDSKYNGNQFSITLYGKTTENESIVAHIYDFHPYFYVKVPYDWDETKCFKFLTKSVLQNSNKKYYFKVNRKLSTLVRSTDFYGFHYDTINKCITQFNYYKIVFHSFQHMKNCSEAIQYYYHTQQENELYSDWFTQDKMSNNNSYMYESDIHPVLRFIHETNIKPAGWVSCLEINQKNHKDCFSCHEIVTSMKHIQPIHNESTSAYVVASFDIECDSSHGDFPQAFKDHKKLAVDIFDTFRKLIKWSPFQYEKHKISTMKNCIQYAFSMIEKIPSKYTIHKIYSENGQPTEDSITECITTIVEDENIHATLSSKENVKGKDRDKQIQTITKLLNTHLKNKDGNKICIQGDPIIQIGTVFKTFGSDEPPLRHIIVIGPEDSMAKDEICDESYLTDHSIVVVRCQTEKELLQEWQSIICQQDPDFITGYNIFGFDFKYIVDRAKHCLSDYEKKKFYNLGRIDASKEFSGEHYNKKCKPRNQQLSSSALGDNQLSYITMDGRILFDIQKEVQKGYNLESYTLDNVSSHFMRGKIKNIQENQLLTDSIGHLKAGDYISFVQYDNIGEHYYKNGQKIQITSIQDHQLCMEETIDIATDQYHKIEWCLHKDDVTPQDIFDNHKNTSENGPRLRSEIAKYCIQDCELCINLLLLLDIIPNNLAMADVSYVPASYIFLRGQGVKITSVVSKKCNEQPIPVRMPTLLKTPNLKEYKLLLEDNYSKESIIYELLQEYDGYKIKKYEKWYAKMFHEYSIVKDHIDEAHDYLKGINTKNITHDKRLHWSSMMLASKPKGDIIYQMIVDDGWQKIHFWEYESYYQMICEPPPIEGYEGATVLDPNPADIYLEDPISVLDFASLYPSSIREKNLSPETQIEDLSLLDSLEEGQDYKRISYTNYEYLEKGKSIVKQVNQDKPELTCYFATPELLKGEGIIPSVLNDLLTKRSETKKRMKKETNEFKQKLLDGLQLAYKVTANSVYGQLGAKTSTIYKKEIAACTTSIGRARIDDAARGVKEWAKQEGYKEPSIVYGDTDSVFVKFSRELKDGTILQDKEALQHCIDCGIKSGDYITEMLHKEDKSPQVLEYEKTFYPFILISKKRYVGDKYEYNTTDCKRTSMGIVLKRRDNANIVKHVFGTIIEKIMIERDFEVAKEWLVQTLQEIRDGKFHSSMFKITKSLRGYYKNPQQIAHKVLADRMAERDPGNKPKSNDRIPYLYVIPELPEPPIIGYKQNSIKEKIEVGHYKNGKTKYKTITKKLKGEAIRAKQTILQGDRIEHINYVSKHKIPIDYDFYITNQIMNPVKQVLDLRLPSEETEKLFQIK